MQIANQDLIIKDHTEFFPNTSFGERGPSVDWIKSEGYYVITVWKPYDHATEKLVPAAPHLYDGMCCIVDVEPLTQEELDQRVVTQWQVIRTQRNQMLKDTDWTQVLDSPVDKAAWATYRQALRDITTQADPFNITWPNQNAI
jgi:hypothetical protein